MFSYRTKDQIEFADSPRPGGMTDKQSERGGVFGQLPTPYGRTGVFRGANWNMPRSVAAQDYGLISPDGVTPLPHSVMNPGLGCYGCSQNQGMSGCALGSCSPGLGVWEVSDGFKAVLGAGLAVGMLYLMWMGAKNIRLM